MPSFAPITRGPQYIGGYCAPTPNNSLRRAPSQPREWNTKRMEPRSARKKESPIGSGLAGFATEVQRHRDVTPLVKQRVYLRTISIP